MVEKKKDSNTVLNNTIKMLCRVLSTVLFKIIIIFRSFHKTFVESYVNWVPELQHTDRPMGE